MCAPLFPPARGRLPLTGKMAIGLLWFGLVVLCSFSQGWQTPSTAAHILEWRWGHHSGGGGCGGCALSKEVETTKKISAAVGSSITNHQVLRSPVSGVSLSRITLVYLRTVFTFLHPFCSHSLSLSLYLVLFLVQTKKATAMPQTTLFYLFSCGSFGSATAGKTFHILNLLAGSFSPFPFPCPRPYPHPPFHAAYLFPRLLLQSILLLCLCFTCSSVLFGIFTKFLHWKELNSKLEGQFIYY